jgi:hypothetical protein
MNAPRKFAATLAADVTGYVGLWARMRPACAAVRPHNGKPHRPGLKRARRRPDGRIRWQ